LPFPLVPSQEQVEQRREDLDVLYETTPDYHPNLFANLPESEFLARAEREALAACLNAG